MEYVEKARAIGFREISVGKVMADAGYVKDAQDPHLTISGISRQVYIEECLIKLVADVERRAATR